MKPTSDSETSRSSTPSEKPPTEPKVPTVEEVETIATTTSQEPTEEVITIKPSPTTETIVIKVQTEPIEVEEETEESEEESEEEEEIVTNVPLTLGDIYTQTRGPPLVPTDYKVSETTYPPTMEKVTTEEYISSEIDLETTETSEVATSETGI